MKSFLDFIAGPESGGRYDVAYGGTRLPPGLTLGQAIQWARRHGKSTGSSAIGRYQFLASTLEDIAKDIDPNTPFTPQLQDMLATRLLERRGLSKYQAGQLSPQQFAQNLSQEWAGLPSGPEGRSYYHGDQMGNKAGVGWDETLAAITGRPGVDVRTAAVGNLPSQMQVPGDPMTGMAMNPETGDPYNEQYQGLQNQGLSPQLLAQLGILPSMQTQAPMVRMEDKGFAGNMFNDPWFIMGSAIAGQGGGPMGDIGRGGLAAGEAMRQQVALENELNQAQAKRSSAQRLPQNIEEMILLKSMHPELTDEQAMSMAFTGTVKGQGTEFQKIGERIYRVERNPFGNPTMTPLAPEEQQEYESIIGSQKKAENVGSKFGQIHVDTIVGTSSSLAQVSSQLAQDKELLARFEAGEFDNASGAVIGRIKQYFDPNTAELQSREMEATLKNLGIENLAPVSNYEIDLIRKMYASSFSTPEQNKAILRQLVRIREAKQKALQRTLQRLKTESIEEYLMNPESVDIEIPQEAQPAPSPAPAPGQPSAGPDAVDTWLNGR